MHHVIRQLRCRLNRVGSQSERVSAMSSDLAALREIFRAAPFVADLGMELVSVGAGECVTVLDVAQRHLQQNGFIHAGVQATMADHTGWSSRVYTSPSGLLRRDSRDQDQLPAGGEGRTVEVSVQGSEARQAVRVRRVGGILRLGRQRGSRRKGKRNHGRCFTAAHVVAAQQAALADAPASRFARGCSHARCARAARLSAGGSTPVAI